MKQRKVFILCTMLSLVVFCGTACGTNGNNNGTQAPYEDEADTGNLTNQNKNNAGSDLKDAGRNLMDSIEDTGDAIRNGVEDLADPNNDMDVDPNDNAGNDNAGNEVTGENEDATGNPQTGTGTTNNSGVIAD